MYLAFLILTPIGLLLDLIGCLVIIQYGNLLNVYFGSGPPPPELGQEGSLYFEIENGDDVSAVNKKRNFATYGISLITAGFLLQIFGATATVLHYLNVIS